MVTVNVSIEAVVLNCDESVKSLELERGYSIEKKCICELNNKKRIRNELKEILYEYSFSKIANGSKELEFMILSKQETISLNIPQSMLILYCSNLLVSLEEEQELVKYIDIEHDYLNKVFSMLTVSKKGDIWLKDIFFTFECSELWGKPVVQNKLWVTNKVIKRCSFTLPQDEIAKINTEIQRVNSQEFNLLYDVITKFVWGTEQIDLATGVEQYITALEMIFLLSQQKGKKGCLARRYAVLKGETREEREELYESMLKFYEYRSDSLHEGIVDNIDIEVVNKLEAITRESVAEALDSCKSFLAEKPQGSVLDFKRQFVEGLKDRVTQCMQQGEFSQENSAQNTTNETCQSNPPSQ